MSYIIEKISSQIKNLFSYPLVKTIGAETTLIVQVFAQMQLALFTILALVIIDLTLGILAAMRHKCVSSWKFKDSVIKLAFYVSLILIGAVVQGLWGSALICEAFIGLIVSTEILSILENIEINFPGVLPRKLVEKLGVTFSKRKNKHCK